jgi:lipopolysaccharide/colanic/teichoic acid biosynthesis glycosyltransferase
MLFIRLSLMAGDLIFIALSMWIAYEIRLGGQWMEYLSVFSPTHYIRVGIYSLPVYLIIFWALQLYNVVYLMDGMQEYNRVVMGCTYGTAIMLVIDFLIRDGYQVSRGWMIIHWGLSIMLMMAWRFTFRHVIRLLQKRGHCILRTLIVGSGEKGKTLAMQWANDPSIQVIGFLDDFLPMNAPIVGDLRVLGTPAMLDEIVEAHDINNVVVIPVALMWESFENLVLRANRNHRRYAFKVAPDFYEVLTTGVQVTHQGFVPMMTIRPTRFYGLEAAAKSIFDTLLAAAAVIACSPLMLIIALILKWTAPKRDILRRYSVYGRQSFPFTALEFDVNMFGMTQPDSSQGDTLRGERITPFGRRFRYWLYRSRAYVLPQLFNVLRQKMSLIGPRPVPVGNQTKMLHWLPQLQSVKPGITGPWAFKRNLTLDEEARLDLYYIRNWTIWLDLEILSRSIRFLLTFPPRTPREGMGIPGKLGGADTAGWEKSSSMGPPSDF